MKPALAAAAVGALMLGAMMLSAREIRAQETTGPEGPGALGAPVADEAATPHLLVEQLEGRIGDGTDLRWQAEASAGPDAWKVRVRSEGDRTSAGPVEDGQLELLFSTPITTDWDVQAGGRYDLDSGPGRAWAALGIEGRASQVFDLGATVYAGGHGVAGKLEAAYDQRITRRLVLQPEAELNAYSQADPARRIGPGVSDLDAGLRLRYEISPKFGPYAGLAWTQTFGKTADLVRAAGEATGDVRFAVGVRSWF